MNIKNVLSILNIVDLAIGVCDRLISYYLKLPNFDWKEHPPSLQKHTAKEIELSATNCGNV